MDQKLQEITEKLFQEGVVRGNEEADKIVGDAREKADAIVEKAKKEASVILSEAEKKAAELSKNTQSELQMASRQLISALEQEVVALVNGKVVDDAVKPITDDKQFVQQLILAAVENWASGKELKIIVNPADKKSVEDFFAAKAKQLLDKGVTIESANNVKAGFQIGPSDGSYKVSFTREDFIRFFKEFLRPKLIELLFEGN